MGLAEGDDITGSGAMRKFTDVFKEWQKTEEQFQQSIKKYGDVWGLRIWMLDKYSHPKLLKEKLDKIEIEINKMVGK